ncbi:Glycerol-3-phosphate/dihydroxyacetone phosphate acyltransferase, partial [Coemansia sp. RSA 2681]
LRYYGIRDHQVDTMRIGRAEAGALFVWRLLWLLIMGLVALPGTVLNLPVFVVTGVVSKSKARAALAASTVKVRARDVIATWKILIALGLVPLLYTTYSVLAVLFVRRRDAAPAWAAAMVAGIADWPSSRIYLWAWALAAFMSYTALVFGEQAVDIVKSVRPLFLTLILGEEHTELLARQREDLSDDITDLVNELGPKIYPEFAKTRVPADLLLGDGKKTHDNLINGSADVFHRKMREGEQALRQRMGGGGGSSSNLRQDAADDSSPPSSSPSSSFANVRQQRRPSKYSFSPPTPRTMATLNSISPMEFLTSVGGPPHTHSSATSHEDAVVAAEETRKLPEEGEDVPAAAARETTGSDGGGAPSAAVLRSSAATTLQYQGGTPATTGPSTPEPQNGMFDFS